MGKPIFLRCFKTDYRFQGIIIGEMNFYLPYEHILTNNFSNMINEYLMLNYFGSLLIPMVNSWACVAKGNIYNNNFVPHYYFNANSITLSYF